MWKLWFATGLLGFVAVGCVGGCWTPTAYPDQLVWADDDSAIGVLELRFEERQGDPLSGTTDKQNFAHQVRVADADGNDPVDVGVEYTGQNGAEFYFMNSRGYFVVSSVVDGGTLAFARVDAASGERVAIPAPAGGRDHYVVPAPDGDILARMTPDAGNTTVQFLDADTLEELGAGIDVTTPSFADWTFRPDGMLVISDGTTAFAVDGPGATPVAAEVPGCVWPKTTSSTISSTGVMVSWDPDAEVVRFGAEDAAAAFGCQ